MKRWVFWIITIFPMFVFLMTISLLTVLSAIIRNRRAAEALLNLILVTGEWYRKRIPTEAFPS